MDETMFGGRRSGRLSWGATGKNIVFGIYQRNGKDPYFLSLPVLKIPCSPILPNIPKLVVYTILMIALPMTLPVRGNHVVVLKEKGIPKGRNHINGIEGFCSSAQHWLY